MFESTEGEVPLGDTPRAPQKSRPNRSCVGCGEPVARDEHEVVRLVLDDAGGAHVDLRGRSFGRGAWVHTLPACLERAAKVGLSRSFRTHVAVNALDLVRALQAATHQRVEALLKTGARSRKMVMGASAVADAFEHQRAHAVIIATDARAAASSREVALAVVEGRALVWGTKDQLGKIAGRTEVGVIAVVDRELALGLLRCSAVLQMPEPNVQEKTHKRIKKVDE